MKIEKKLQFLTDRAKLRTRVLNTELAIKEWKYKHDNVVLDWENNRQYKYYLMYYFENKLIEIRCFLTGKFPNTIYFSSRVKAEQCIKDIGKERIIEWIKWEETDQ